MKILQICPSYMSGTATKKSLSTVLFTHTSDYLCYLRRKLQSTCPPNLQKCHHTNLWIAKLLHLTEGLLRSIKFWRIRKEPVVGCLWWLWKELVVMCDNWNARQAMSQQVFRVTTFCDNTCFQSFSTLISRTVHHAELKFSPCRNKPSIHAHLL